MFPNLVVQYQSHVRGMFVDNRKARDHPTEPRAIAVKRPRFRGILFLAFLPLLVFPVRFSQRRSRKRQKKSYQSSWKQQKLPH